MQWCLRKVVCWNSGSVPRLNTSTGSHVPMNSSRNSYDRRISHAVITQHHLVCMFFSTFYCCFYYAFILFTIFFGDLFYLFFICFFTLHHSTVQQCGCTILIVKNRKNIESEFCLSVYHWYAHGRQRRCQEDPVSLPSSRLEKTTRSSPHHVAQHRPTGSETTPPYAPWSSRYGSEPPFVGDDVSVA